MITTKDICFYQFKGIAAGTIAKNTITYGSVVNVRDLKEMVITVHGGATGATASPGLTVTMQTQQADGSWYDMPTGISGRQFAFAKLTATGSKTLQMVAPFGKTMRAKLVTDDTAHWHAGVYAIAHFEAT